MTVKTGSWLVNMDQLLNRRQAYRIGSGGDTEKARQRLPLSRLLWENYRAFNPLRLHLAHNAVRPLRMTGGSLRHIADRLMDAGFLKAIGSDRFAPTGGAARLWLLGGWLEELGYCAMMDAGAEEAVYAQRIAWTVGAVAGENEIDVIARKGSVLSFMSCKTVSPVYDAASPSERDKYRAFLLEADYWETHFADGDGRAVLLVSADLLDETAGDLPRCPTLMARAEVLDADIIGLEDDPWPALVRRLSAHWTA